MQAPLLPLPPAQNSVYTQFIPASAQATDLSPLTSYGTPKALTPSAFMHAAGQDALSPAAECYRPTFTDKHTPQPVEPHSPGGATPGIRAQWLATKVRAEMTQFCASLATLRPHGWVCHTALCRVVLDL